MRAQTSARASASSPRSGAGAPHPQGGPPLGLPRQNGPASPVGAEDRRPVAGRTDRRPPGETERSLRTTAKYRAALPRRIRAGRRAFLRRSVSPLYRFADRESAPMGRAHGRARPIATVVARRRSGLSGGVGRPPSRGAGFSSVSRARHELFRPIPGGIAARSTTGPCTGLFGRAISGAARAASRRTTRARVSRSSHLWVRSSVRETPTRRAERAMRVEDDLALGQRSLRSAPRRRARAAPRGRRLRLRRGRRPSRRGHGS